MKKQIINKYTNKRINKLLYAIVKKQEQFCHLIVYLLLHSFVRV